VEKVAKLLLLLILLASLFVVTFLISGKWEVPKGDPGLYFQIGLYLVILGSLFIEQYFTRPSDVIVNSLVVIISLFTISNKDVFIYWMPLLIGSIILFVSSIFSIAVFNPNKPDKSLQNKISKFLYNFATYLGRGKRLFSLVFILTALSYYSVQSRELLILVLFWGAVIIIDPIRLSKLLEKIRRLFAKGHKNKVGDVLYVKNPNIVVGSIRDGVRLSDGDVLSISLKARNKRNLLGIVLDKYYFSDQNWVHIYVLEKILLEEDINIFEEEKNIYSKSGEIYKYDVIPEGVKDTLEKEKVWKERDGLIGLVKENSNINEIVFEIVKDSKDITEGRIVKVDVRGIEVLYQIIDGYTSSEILDKRNIHGFIKGKAKKIGFYDESSKGFKISRWVPYIYTPVYLLESKEAGLDLNSVGKIPGSDYFVNLDTNYLVTHNTAILGILGIGKTCLAIELILRIIKDKIKVICVDITGQYKANLGIDEENFENLKQGIATSRDNIDDNNPRGGGNYNVFREAMKEKINEFMEQDRLLMIINPYVFDVTKQVKKGYQFIITELTVVEITRIITEAIFETLKKEITDQAKACIVYEEAHTLIPEWNSVASEGDQIASNGIAKAILQGRKYGLGCIIVTQRTANVTKSILNQCNTVFAMRVFDATGMDFLKNYIGQDYANILSSLEDRYAVVFGKASSSKQPVILELNDLSEFKSLYYQESQS